MSISVNIIYGRRSSINEEQEKHDYDVIDTFELAGCYGYDLNKLFIQPLSSRIQATHYIENTRT